MEIVPGKCPAWHRFVQQVQAGERPQVLQAQAKALDPVNVVHFLRGVVSFGLLDDDGSQLRPVEEPGTDPEPWKVFTPLSYEPGRTDQTESVLERPPKSAASGSNKARSRPKPAAAAAALESTKGRTSGTARESKALKTRLASLERGGGAGMPRRMGNRHNASLRRTVPRR